MASIASVDSPRRVLGFRDPNQLAASPGKRDRSGLLAESESGKASSLLGSKIESLSRSPAGAKKRNAEVLDEIADIRGNKRTAVENPCFNLKTERATKVEDAVGDVLNVEGNDGGNTVYIEEEAASSRDSFSPDTSFNDSQNTSITEPEDIARLIAPLLSFQSVAPPGTMGRQEARTKAETLRLRLEFAMYKVRTNQTDIPLSRLQVRRTSPPRSLPTNHSTTLASLPRLEEQVLPQLRMYPQEDSQEEYEAREMPSSPPPTPKYAEKGLATPVLSRSRGGFLCPEESPEKGLTSSVVKGRAADGLLSLMSVGK